MSTHSGIGIKRKDGSVDATYCHFDGYLDSVGKCLNNNFTNAVTVSDLIMSGEIRSIHNNGNVDYFEDTRDYPKNFQSLDSFLDSDLGSEEFVYVFDENTNRWYFLNGSAEEDFGDDLNYDENMKMFVLDSSLYESEHIDFLEDYFNYHIGEF